MLMTISQERRMKMGLDFSIEAHFHREKDNEVDDFDIEIAYFRKFWSLRTEIMWYADKNPQDVIETQEDFLVRTKLEVLPRVMEYLLDACKDRTNIIFEDSIWGEVNGRASVLRQLSRMSDWDNLFVRFPDILVEDEEHRRDYLNNSLIYDAVISITQDADCKLSPEEFLDILLHLEDWDISLCFYNSY